MSVIKIGRHGQIEETSREEEWTVESKYKKSIEWIIITVRIKRRTTKKYIKESVSLWLVLYFMMTACEELSDADDEEHQNGK